MGDVMAAAQPWLATAAAFWLYVRYTFWLLWLARVSIASALLGFALFAFTPQMQDMFLEMRVIDFFDKLFWIAFCFTLVFGWVMAVHNSAEWIIKKHEDWPMPSATIARSARPCLSSWDRCASSASCSARQRPIST
jgi:hypothetical protein